jgi:hypothetical protein
LAADRFRQYAEHSGSAIGFYPSPVSFGRFISLNHRRTRLCKWEGAMIDVLEQAIRDRSVVAFRNAAARQLDIAATGTSSAGEKYPGVVIRSPEAACAVNLADDWAEIADILQQEGGK